MILARYIMRDYPQFDEDEEENPRSLEDRRQESKEICNRYGYELGGYIPYRKMTLQDALIVRQFIDDEHDLYLDQA